MSDTVIRVENLGKKYVLGHQQQERYTALRDVIANGAKGLIHSLQNGKGKGENNQEEFWALKDVSFEIKQGDRVGIIGRNGAGKSTLLKILSRITEPTKGSIKIKGRVASLLEVGTGFHPELTGRENIYLNGAILGMGKEEIKRKFDEIVAFAEVEKFLDTPVKRYSSGMYVRLAFAVAAHLEPEILIVDEVLAVGDAQFQEKCLGKMEDVGKEGRTVLFVSHNMDAIRKLSTKGVFMKAGTVVFQGEIDAVIQKYIHQFYVKKQSSIMTFDKTTKTGFYIDRIEILDLEGNPKESLLTWDSVRFRIFFYAPKNFRGGSIEFFLSTTNGLVLIACSSHFDSKALVEFREGINQIDCVFPKLMLSAGKYLLGGGITIPNSEWLYKQTEAIVLEIGAKDVYNSGLAPQMPRCVTVHDYTWK